MAANNFTIQNLTAFRLEPAIKIKLKLAQRQSAISGRFWLESYSHNKPLLLSFSTFKHLGKDGTISLSQHLSVVRTSLWQLKTVTNDAEIPHRTSPKNQPKSTESKRHKLLGMNSTRSENCRLCGSSKMYFRSTKIFRAFPSVTPIILGRSELAPRP